MVYSPGITSTIRFQGKYGTTARLIPISVLELDLRSGSKLLRTAANQSRLAEATNLHDQETVKFTDVCAGLGGYLEGMDDLIPHQVLGKLPHPIPVCYLSPRYLF